MNQYEGFLDFIADEIFKHGSVTFNRQGLFQHMPQAVLVERCRERGWELLDDGANGVAGVTIRQRQPIARVDTASWGHISVKSMVMFLMDWQCGPLLGSPPR